MTVVKKDNVHELLVVAWHEGKVSFNTVHSLLRSDQRRIGALEVRDVILYGEREPLYDKYNEQREHWTYSLRNKNVDGYDIRMIFDVEAYPQVIVVTVMHVYP